MKEKSWTLGKGIAIASIWLFCIVPILQFPTDPHVMGIITGWGMFMGSILTITIAFTP